MSFISLKLPIDTDTVNHLLFYSLCKQRFASFTKSDIENYHKRKSLETAIYALKHSPFFKKFYSGYDLRKFNSLPWINKKIMMENLGEYNTLGFTKKEIMDFCLETEKTRDFSKRYKRVNIGMSSGTSGNKGVELATVREENYMKAALLARFDFPEKEKINLAFVLRVSSPAFNLNKFGHRLTYIDQLSPLENIIIKLQTIQPNILSAPPSMLKIFAREKEKSRLAINPKRLISYAEVLYPDVKNYLEMVFGCAVSEIYKCTEGPVAISCKHNSLHINEDMVLVETLDPDGSPTLPGKPCFKMLITDLHKRSQPIIRYELNDIITISKNNCPCGSNFRVIEKIQGRSDDMFWGLRKKTGEKQFIYQDYITRAIISTSDAIIEFQAIQTDYKKVILRIKLNYPADKVIIEKSLVEKIKGVFNKYDCESPKVDVLFEEPEVNEFSHKLIRVICKIKQ